MISENLASVAKLPLVISVCFIILFYYLGVSFFAGIGIFIIAFVVNVFLGKTSAKMQKVYMKKQDARVNITTESINNMKMLKLYGWTD